MDEKPLISVIIPIHNGEQWINDCFESILQQDILQKEKIEISVYDDSSTDNTYKLLTEWNNTIKDIENLSVVISNGEGAARGVGYAKNQAVNQSHGEYLCFQDIDDVMLPRRITAQYEEAKNHPDAIIGCQVKRIPENSTPRFITWANKLHQDLLTIQIYTSHGPTVLMPTWFLSRSVYDRAGKFSEEGRGTSEDLLFFYSHLDGGGTVRRVDEILLVYRYHPNCTTFSVAEFLLLQIQLFRPPGFYPKVKNRLKIPAVKKQFPLIIRDDWLRSKEYSLLRYQGPNRVRMFYFKETIWNVRLAHLEKRVLPKWPNFTIWNAGKQGRRLYRSLKPSTRKKVTQFCDVDPKKTGKFYEPYFKASSGERVRIPIVHFTKAKPPFITCVKLDLTNGEFEKNLNSLNLVEGEDFIVFS